MTDTGGVHGDDACTATARSGATAPQKTTTANALRRIVALDI
jgi:hypothetical protein